jgi:hypothetical protein
MAETISCAANFPAFVLTSTIDTIKLTANTIDFAVTGGSASFGLYKAPLTAGVAAFDISGKDAGIRCSRLPLTANFTTITVAQQSVVLSLQTNIPFWAGNVGYSLSCGAASFTCSHIALLAQRATIVVDTVPADVKRPDMVATVESFVISEVAAELLLNPPKAPLETTVSEVVVSAGTSVFPRQLPPLITETQGVEATPWPMWLNHNKATLLIGVAGCNITGQASWQYRTRLFSANTTAVTISGGACSYGFERIVAAVNSPVDIATKQGQLRQGRVLVASMSSWLISDLPVNATSYSATLQTGTAGVVVTPVLSYQTVTHKEHGLSTSLAITAGASNIFFQRSLSVAGREVTITGKAVSPELFMTVGAGKAIITLTGSLANLAKGGTIAASYHRDRMLFYIDGKNRQFYNL